MLREFNYALVCVLLFSTWDSKIRAGLYRKLSVSYTINYKRGSPPKFSKENLGGRPSEVIMSEGHFATGLMKQRLVKFSLLGLVEENKLWKRGCRCVAGLDEAGRGALCGPVVAAAVTIQFNNLTIKQLNTFNGLKDSKKLSFQKREFFYRLLTEYPLVEWGIGRVGQRVIDKINILEATKLAMKRAIKDLTKKFHPVKSAKGSAAKPQFNRVKNLRTQEQKKEMFLIVDGNFKISLRNIPQKAIIKADEKVFSCAAASILAKVTRDRAMLRYDEKYPQYGFAGHKGYGTKLHLEALKKYGPCPLHRTSFAPVRDCYPLRV